MMVLSTLGSGMSVLWSMVALGMVVYVFGVYLTQVALQHLELEDGEASAGDRDLLEEHFGSLPRASYTLFLAITGGVGWKPLADIFFDIHWINGTVFCFYMFFCLFVVLNIITGMFVETAINSVHNDRNEVIMEEMRAENSRVKKLKRIFDEADVEHRGLLRYAELDRILLDPKTHALLRSMGLEVDEAQGIYPLLDPTHKGEVSIEEFVVGCLRLLGGAKSVDLVTLLYENKKMMDA